jgi:hypothetical protein
MSYISVLLFSIFYLVTCKTVQNLPNYQSNYKGKIIYKSKEIPVTVTLISNQIDDESGNVYSKPLFAQLIFDYEKIALAMMGDANHHDPNSLASDSGAPISGMNTINLQFQKDVLLKNQSLDLVYQSKFFSLFKKYDLIDCAEGSIALVGRDTSNSIKGNLYGVWCDENIYRKKIGEFYLEKIDKSVDFIKREPGETVTKSFIFKTITGEVTGIEKKHPSAVNSPFPSLPRSNSKKITKTSYASHVIFSNTK